MATTVERLAQDALALSDPERAELAQKILVSLDGVPDKGSEDAWQDEILLPEKLRARESPNNRRKLSESIFEGPFKSQ